MTRRNGAMNNHGNGAGSSGGWSAGLTLNGPLGVSLIALAIAGIVVLSGMSAIMSSAFGRGTGDVKPVQEMEQIIAKHNESMKTWQERFNGRSAFFRPPAPIVHRPEPVIPRFEPPPPREEPPAGPPPNYTGPSIAFAYDNVVYFNAMSANDNPKYMRIRVGEEVSGLRVISISLPWSVKVGFRGGEYDVAIFNRTQDALVAASPKPAIMTPFVIQVPAAEPPAVAATPPDPVAAAAMDPTGEGRIRPERGARARPGPERPGREHAPTRVGEEVVRGDQIEDDGEEIAPDYEEVHDPGETEDPEEFDPQIAPAAPDPHDPGDQTGGDLADDNDEPFDEGDPE